MIFNIWSSLLFHASRNVNEAEALITLATADKHQALFNPSAEAGRGARRVCVSVCMHFDKWFGVIKAILIVVWILPSSGYSNDPLFIQPN